jgi:polysaccharide export outer membrane protein
MSSASTFILIVASVFTFSACTPTNKLPKNYFENMSDTSGKDAVRLIEPRIQKNDLLSIQVYSESLKPEESDLPYNLPNMGAVTATGRAVSGFLVDQSGNITYPRIGQIHVEGLTKHELADIIKERFKDELTNPSVIIRFLNFKVTVLGEVARPGSYDIPTERVTILEALGLAGDIPITGKRENVKIVREANGEREVGIIDLTSKNMFESPFYNLQQNDVIYVEATRAKIKQQTDQATFQRVSLALSIITSIALLYNVFR